MLVQHARCLHEGLARSSAVLDAATLCEQAEHDSALRAALLNYVERKLYAADERAQAAGTAVAEQLLRGRGLLLPEQVDTIWNWAFQELRCSSSAQLGSLAVAAEFTQRAADTLTQKKAADLYTGCLKPLLAQLRLPWAEEQSANCLPCSPLGHVLWAAEQSDSHALRLAPHIPLLLSCFLAVERRVDPRPWRRHVTCDVHMGSTAARDTSRCELDTSASSASIDAALCALHARSICAVQVSSLRDSLASGDGGSTGDTCAVILEAAGRYTMADATLESALRPPASADASPGNSDGSRRIQPHLRDALASAPIVNGDVYAEVFVLALRHAAPPAVIFRALSHTAAYAARCCERHVHPETTTAVLQCLIRTGSLHAAVRMAFDKADDAVAALCFQMVSAALRGASKLSQLALDEVLACMDYPELQQHCTSRAADVADATTMALCLDLLYEVVPDDAASAHMLAMLHAKSAALSLPLDAHIFNAAAACCLPAPAGRLTRLTLENATPSFRRKWLHRALRDAQGPEDARGIIAGALCGFENAAAVPGGAHSHAWPQWSIDPAADWTPVIDVIVSDIARLLLEDRSMQGVKDALSLFTRLCSLQRCATHARDWLPILLVAAPTIMSAASFDGAMEHEDAASVVDTMRALCEQAAGASEGRQLKRLERLRSLAVDAATVFARAHGLSANASEPGSVGLSSVQEDAAPDADHAAAAECEDVDFEPSDMSSSDDDGSGPDAFFMRPA